VTLGPVRVMEAGVAVMSCVEEVSINKIYHGGECLLPTRVDHMYTSTMPLLMIEHC